MDVWVRRSDDNAQRLTDAITAFGFASSDLDARKADVRETHASPRRSEIRFHCCRHIAVPVLTGFAFDVPSPETCRLSLKRRLAATEDLRYC